MIDSPLGTRPSPHRRWVGLGVAALLAVVLVSGCDDGNGPEPGTPFGRIGSVRVTIDAPIDTTGTSKLLQSISWNSDGRWTLTEAIYYRDALGDATVSHSSEDAGVLAQRYGNWISNVNDSTSGLGLFLQDLPADLVPACDSTQYTAISTVTVVIADAQRGDSIAWTRCGQGTLATLSSEDARPDRDAARVVDAARILRNFTVNAKGDFKPAYVGSIPFRTILRGDNNALLTPRVLDNADSWSSFWKTYVSATMPVSPVDFAHEVVIVAAVGLRQEAGDSVEVRGVLRVAFGTQVNVAEQRLGDFCTPAPRLHAPFHIVAAPFGGSGGAFQPIYFAVQDSVDKIPCG